MATMGDGLTRQQGKSKKKEPEWNDLCKDVFDQYLSEEDPFKFDDGEYTRNTSQDSTMQFGSSNLSDPSTCATDTSPMPPEQCSLSTPSQHRPAAQPSIDMEARQPRVQPPLHFWNRTLKTLERTAVDREQKVNKLRAVRSHPDFLSLGGFPSPPAVPSPSTLPPLNVQRQRSRVSGSGPSGKKVISTRSVSRGRTSAGVSKLPATIHPIATIRKRSTSPTKMLNQPRHRSGVYDAVVSRAAIDVTSAWSSQWPVSPSPATCYMPTEYIHVNRYDPSMQTQHQYSANEPISPLTHSLQNAHIHAGYNIRATRPIVPSIYDNIATYAPNQNHTSAQSAVHHPIPAANMPTEEIKDSYPARASPIEPSKIQSFDFGFDVAMEPDYWDNGPEIDTQMVEYATMPYQTTSLGHNFHYNGSATTRFSSQFVPTSMTTGYDTTITPYEAQSSYAADLPNASRTISPKRNFVSATPNLPVTPSRRQSESPLPMDTEASSRRTNRSHSRSRTASRHRRTKSVHSASRTIQSPEKGGFVNYTPQDSGKLLSGVAPSGSSKTKARREKEAADRRRILSQAAVKAVVDAGGDLNALSAAGLLM